MPISNYPSGFSHGVAIQGMPILNTYGGNVFWVDSGAGSNGNDGTFVRPFATIDYAVGQCTANNGDIIMVKPGHSETVTAAGGIDLDVAGITIQGLGAGSDRPTINFTTATTADVDVDAANITVDNIYFDVTGIDAVVAALDVNAADFTLRNCEVLMSDATGQAVKFIVTAAAANNMRVLNCVIRSPNAGADSAIQLVGATNGVEIAGNHIYGDFADAALHNPTANVATNVNIHDNYFRNEQTGDHAVELVSAVTGAFNRNVLVSDAIATAADLGATVNADNWYSDLDAADAAAVAYPETATTGGSTISGIDDKLGTITNTGGTATVGALIGDLANDSLLARLNDIGSDVNSAVTSDLQGKIGTDTELADRSIYDQLNGGGPAAAASAAAPANDVSLYGALRYVSEQQSQRYVTKSAVALTNGLDLFTVTGTVAIKYLYLLCATGNDTTASTIQFNAVPTVGTATTLSGASASVASAAAGATITLAGTALATAALYAANGPNLIANPGTVLVPAGVIDVVVGVGSTTGTWSAHLVYEPLSAGASVTAA